VNLRIHTFPPKHFFTTLQARTEWNMANGPQQPYTSPMKEKSLSKTNPWIARHASSGQFIVRNIASSTAVETNYSIKDTSNRILTLRAAKPAKPSKKSA
jgi:hypothetical protein